MNKLFKTLALVVWLTLTSSALAFAVAPPFGIGAIPWLTGTNKINVQVPSAGAATCTSFTTSDVCYLNLTGNLTTLTLSGGVAGGNYVLIFAQDAIGSRTFTVPTNLTASTGVGTLPAIPSAANSWTVWTVQKVGANYVVQSTLDNATLVPNTLVMANPIGATAMCDAAIANVCTTISNANNTWTIQHISSAAGNYLALIVTQDATGGRTQTLTIGGGGVINLPNGGTVGTNLFNTTASATSMTEFLDDGTNLNLVSIPGEAIGGGPYTVVTNGTGVGIGAAQAQTAVTITGMTTTSLCVCQPQTLPATWQTGIALACVPTANTATCQEVNGTAAAITPAAITLNIMAFY